MKLTTISPSRIKTWQHCRFKYWLTYSAKEPLKGNYGGTLGTLIHNILENYAKGLDTDYTGRLYKGFAGTLNTLDKFGKEVLLENPLKWAKPADFRDKKPYCDTCPFKHKNTCKISGESLKALTGCPKKLFEEALKLTAAAIKKYSPIYKDKEAIISTEYNYEVPIIGTDVKAIGVMDLVLKRDEDTVEIIDYKTGSWTQNFDQCYEDIQVRMYSWAARREFVDDINKKGYHFKNILLTFDYFTASPITIAFSEIDDNKTEEYVKYVINDIESVSLITRVIGDHGSFDWKCKALCDPDVCKLKWQGPFVPQEIDNGKKS